MAVSCAQNGLPAAAAREAQPRRLECPTSLGSRRAPRPGLQEALRSNTEFVFLSAAPRNCALSGSHECAAEQNVIYREYDNSTGGPLTGGRWVLGDGTESWLPRVSWRLGNEEAANGRDEMSQITREHLAKCAETGSASGSASKSRLVLGQSQVGWRFPSAAFSPRLVDRTVWRAARDGLADAPRAGPRLAPGVTPHEPQPSRARAPWGTLGPPPNSLREISLLSRWDCLGSGFQEQPPSWARNPLSEHLMDLDIFPSVTRRSPSVGRARGWQESLSRAQRWDSPVGLLDPFA